jgi:hypothetical protein
MNNLIYNVTFYILFVSAKCRTLEKGVEKNCYILKIAKIEAFRVFIFVCMCECRARKSDLSICTRTIR